MKTFTREYRFNHIENDLFSRYYGDLTPCVFDIETTGLSAAPGKQQSRVILTAMLIPTRSGVQITQYLAEQPYEEDRVLQKTMEFFAEHQIDYVITYNGITFDIPFMNRRLEALHFPYSMKMYNLDLYSWLRKNTDLPQRLESMSQKRVERFFGIGTDRDDIITGKDSVKLYYEYVQNHSGMIEKIILTHNREDVLQLYRVLQQLRLRGADILKKEDAHQAQADFGFPVGRKGQLAVRPKLTGGKLKLQGIQYFPILDQFDSDSEDSPSNMPFSASYFPDFESNIQTTFRESTSDFEVLVPLEKHSDAAYFDLAGIDFDPALAERLSLYSLDGYVNDYLILSENGNKKHREINVLSALILDHIYTRVRSI